MLSIPPLLEQEYEFLREYVASEFGIFLPEERKFFLETRLRKRMRALGLESWIRYIELLSRPASPEREHCINAVTSNKTHFFREIEHFDYLRKHFLPRLAEQRLSFWIGASSIGAEAYSLAIMIEEYGRINDLRLSYEIYSTDIDTEALAKAGQGVFPDYMVDDHVDMKTRQRYFMRGTGSNAGFYRIDPRLAKNIRFLQHNLLDSVLPVWAKKFDVVLIRNVFIYFQPKTIAQVMNAVTRMLQPGGVVIVGHCEALRGDYPQFVNLGHSIYRYNVEESS